MWSLLRSKLQLRPGTEPQSGDDSLFVAVALSPPNLSTRVNQLYLPQTTSVLLRATIFFWSFHTYAIVISDPPQPAVCYPSGLINLSSPSRNQHRCTGGKHPHPPRIAPTQHTRVLFLNLTYEIHSIEIIPRVSLLSVPAP